MLNFTEQAGGVLILMKYFICVMVLMLYVVSLAGCTTFTQEDYDLQQKRYERDRQVDEQKAKESVYLKW